MKRLLEFEKQIEKLPCVKFDVVGSVKQIIGISIEVSGLLAPIGSRCSIVSNGNVVYADVVGFKNDVALLQALDGVSGIEPNAEVHLVSRKKIFQFSDNLLGCVIDPLGNVLIGENTVRDETITVDKPPLRISERGFIEERFETGIKAIDIFLPLGFGQRVGIMAGTGVGKSVLLQMITRYSSADVVVIGLIGERGREVLEFAEEILSSDARDKTVVVAAPADFSPIIRMQGAEVATAIAEHFRDQGKNVLLLMDSVTRYAQAHREVALSAGESPVNKGYPASVFAKLPALIERAGSVKHGGITAIYTVLVEGDDNNDPIGDAARGVLDGHIVLSRAIAERGVYPAIDIPKSISRLSKDLLSPDDFNKVRKIASMYSLLDENADLISLGMIETGANVKLDKAISLSSDLEELVKQNISDGFSISQSEKLRDSMFSEISSL
ncbi:FliI/YscN family ATPase [Photobacterium damselae]|uniref:FliI/YscN family ATPase n=1 Tax=Photobacterium damselae TaxID=38293 RepID=UPI001EEDDFB9|nr:FliI/YscN family ATPase [Photobacterium damselae]UKA04605.1 FliI/YscN family ATPase [Photobacterium damselae subsp. damselae]